MTGDSEVVGETKVRGHCTFSWRELLGVVGAPRIYEINDTHCDLCIAELRHLTTSIVDKRSCAQ